MYVRRYQKFVEKNPEKRNQLKFVQGQLTGMCLFVTSTFGNGEPPEQALSMSKWIDNLLNEQDNETYERLRADGVVNSERNGNSSSCSFSPSKLGLTVSANGFIMEIKIGNITNRFSAEGWNLNSQCISLAVETILSSLIN